MTVEAFADDIDTSRQTVRSVAATQSKGPYRNGGEP
jgi:hypothetical protein